MLKLGNFLTWGPAQRTPAQQMHMQMKDALPRIRARVDHGAESAREAPFPRQMSGHALQISQ